MLSMVAVFDVPFSTINSLIKLNMMVLEINFSMAVMKFGDDLQVCVLKCKGLISIISYWLG